MNEPATIRWRRRAKTIPAMLGVTALAVAAAPVALPALAGVDIVRGRRRLPMARCHLFALQYVVNDSVEIVLAPLYWVMAGFGLRLGSNGSIARHQRLQRWSVRVLERRAEQLLGLRIEVSEQDRRALDGDGQRPVIAISRHVSLFDASLPGLLFDRIGRQPRGIIMAELLADPGFDLLYGRLGSVFISREGGEKARRAIAAMVAGADQRTAYVVFPEGRLFRPSVRDRALERLASSNPERAGRLGGLHHLLPPRPGGLLALLDAVPDADVVVIDHRGLDDHRRLADFASAAPLTEPITVSVRRIERADIPADHGDRVRWLDDLWLELDRGLAGD